jgi:hypothetical protein
MVLFLDADVRAGGSSIQLLADELQRQPKVRVFSLLYFSVMLQEGKFLIFLRFLGGRGCWADSACECSLVGSCRAAPTSRVRCQGPCAWRTCCWQGLPVFS